MARPLSMFQNNPGGRPESPPRRSRGFRTSCGGRRRCLRRKKQKTQHARNRALHCAVLTLHHGSVTLHIHHQQRVRVRVAAGRLVARTRSESSSSALKVLKSSWLAHQSLGSHSTPLSCYSSWHVVDYKLLIQTSNHLLAMRALEHGLELVNSAVKHLAIGS